MPCHAMTSAYAQQLLDRFDGFQTTSDIYTHQLCPGPTEALTVLPPVASELSWSVGAVDSLIHPKLARSQYLRESGDEAAAEANDRAVRSHVQHMFYRPFLIVGHPCAGTG